MNNLSQVRKVLNSLFPKGEILVEAPLGDDQHLRARVVDASFANMTPLARHRKVMQALSDQLQEELHAIELILKPPA